MMGRAWPQWSSSLKINLIMTVMTHGSNFTNSTATQQNLPLTRHQQQGCNRCLCSPRTCWDQQIPNNSSENLPRREHIVLNA
jgi:hypothetical protein